MKVCLICNEYPPAPHGGIGVVVASLAGRLQQAGHQAIVVGYDPRLTQTTWTTEAHDVRVLRLASPPGARWALKVGRRAINPGFFWQRFYLARQAARVAREHAVDLMESYDWQGPLLFAPFHPLVVRMHGANSAHRYAENQRMSQQLRLVERRNIAQADHLIAVSQHIGQLTLEALGQQQRAFDVIYNGVDTARFAPQPVEPDPLEILYVGTVNRRKGVFDLFNALPQVFASVPGAQLSVVGRLPAGAAGEAMQQQLLGRLPEPMRDAVRFMGVQPHDTLPAWYARAAVAVFPSRAEAFGLTCAEAMSCGAAVVMTTQASGPELVEHNVSGLLADPTDPAALAEAIIRLLQDASLRARLGEQARAQAIARFDLDHLWQRNLDFYEKARRHAR